MRDVLFYLVLTSLVVLGEGHQGNWEAHEVITGFGDERYPYDSNTMSPLRFKTVSDASFTHGDEVWVTFYYRYGGYGRLRWSEKNWRVELYHCTDDPPHLTTSSGEEFTNVPHDTWRFWEVSWTRTTFVVKCNGVKVWQYKYAKSKFSDRDCKNMYSGNRGPLTSVQFNKKAGLAFGKMLNVPTEYYTKTNEGGKDEDKNKDKKKKEKKKKEDEGKKDYRDKNKDKKKNENWHWEAHAVTGGNVYQYYSISPIRFKTVNTTSWPHIVCVTFFYGGGSYIWGMLRWYEGNWGVELYSCTDADLLTTFGEGEFTNVPDGPERIWELSSTPTTYVVKCNGVKVWEYQYAKSKFPERECKDIYTGNSGALTSVQFNGASYMNVPTEYYTKVHEGGKVEDTKNEDKNKDKKKKDKKKKDKKKKHKKKKHKKDKN